MKQLLRTTSAYRAFAADRGGAQSSLVLFPDAKYLRALLRECAKAFFGAKDGSRECGLIEKESFSDCLFYPAEGSKLTADDASAIIEESLLRPVEGERKLIVLDAFHTVTPLVQNKLLKVLEEPPEGVSFLLGAVSEYSVLATVRSRLKKYTVSPFSEEQIGEALKRAYPNADTAQAAAASGGIFSAAEELLAGGGEQFRLAEEFLTTADAAGFCRKIADYKEKRGFFSALSLLLRDMLFCREGQERYTALKGARALSEEFPSGAIVAALALTQQAEIQIQFNANFGQSLYALALGIREEKVKWQRLS